MEISFQVPLAVASSQGHHKTKISQGFHQAERSGREFQANGITCPKAYQWESPRIIKEKENIPMGFKIPKSCGIKEKLLTMEITQKRLQWNLPELDREGVGGASPESVRAVRRPETRSKMGPWIRAVSLGIEKRWWVW